MEKDIQKKDQNIWILILILGVVLFIIGLIAYSITETSSVNAFGIEVDVTTRPYGTIGLILIFLGVAAIIGSIAMKIYFSGSSTIIPPQYPQQQYYQHPPQPYYPYPQQQYYQPPPQQYHQNPNPPPQQVRYCPNCKQPTGSQTSFCPSCGAKI
jgi:flagellar basal body-associated protein FliL